MGKILIVEDSEDLRFALSNIVEKTGFSVFSASSGAEARNILNSHIIDLVFLDIGLPDINGIKLIPEIKDISPDIDVVIITAMNDAKTAVTALKSGATDYMIKPFDIIEFNNVI